MFRKILLAALVVAAGFMLLTYALNPVFWQRYVGGFLSAGDGANSSVFDVREVVQGARGEPFPEATILSDEATTALVDYAEQFDSFALLVVVDGRMALEWYRDDYDRDSLTQSQSMHKSVQALLVGIAVDQGLIASIDDPILKYLPELLLEHDQTTIRDLLEMRSGLKPFTGGFSPYGEAFRWLYASDIRDKTLAIPQASEPGRTFDYHDANTQILGMLLDAVYGGRYVEYLSEHLWQPIGADDAVVWLDREEGMAHHNCCLFARAVDWARVGQLIADNGAVNGGEVVSSEWLDLQLRPAGSPHYGLQTWVASNAESNPRPGGGGYARTEDWLADDVVYFSGYGAQRVYISPTQRLVIVRLGPAAGYFPEIIESWDNSFLVNTVLRDLVKTPRGDALSR